MLIDVEGSTNLILLSFPLAKSTHVLKYVP